MIGPHVTRPEEQWEKSGVKIAACYPSQLTPDYERLMTIKREAVLELLSPLAGKKVLDAGTGRAPFAIDLASNGTASVVALDISERMLRIARENARQANVESKITFMQCDAESIPLEDRSFDAVVGIDLLLHLPDPKKAVAEWSRLLKNKGQLIIDFVPLNPISAFFGLTLIDPTLKKRILSFLGVAANDFLSLIFGFAWGRTRFTNRLYYRFFNVPFKHYTKRRVYHLLKQNNIRIKTIKRYGHRFMPFGFMICGYKN